MKKFLINGLVLTFTSLIMRSIAMIFNIYISNKIGAEAVGLFSLVMSIYLFFVTIATSGLNLACTYLVAEQFARKELFKWTKNSSYM